MPNSIERDVYVLRDTLKNPISYVRGTDLLPIIFHFRDFTIPSGATAKVFVAKNDGNAVYGSATITGNDVTVDVTQQMFITLGVNLMQVEIDSGNETLVTFEQPVMVTPNLKAGDLPESTTDIEFLDEAIEQAQEAVKDAQQAIADANTAISGANTAASSANQAAQNANQAAEDLQDKVDAGDFTASVQVGTTTTLDPDQDATVSNGGTSKDAVLNFGIPKGDPGTAASIQVGTTQTVQPEENAEVTNTGTTTAAVLNFKIPRGEDGMTDLTAEYKDASEYTCQPTVNAPVVVKQVDGKTEQVETNGYQLFDASKIKTSSQGGATVINNMDGSFTVSGSGDLNATFNYAYNYTTEMVKKLIKPGNIYLKCESLTTPYFAFKMSSKSAGITQEITNNISNSEQMNIPEDLINANDVIAQSIFYGINGTQIRPGTIKPMLYQDGDGTWEPYTGGQPAPSPDYPQVIKGVGGTGYFDGEWVQGNISSAGAVGTETTGITSANAIPCKQNDNIAVTYEDSIDVIAVAFYNASGAYISTSTSGNSVDTFTATAPANAASFKVNLRVVSGSTITPNGAKYCTVTINGEYQTGVEVTGRNLAEVTQTNKNRVTNGVTFKLNDDGSYTLNGTCTGTSIFRLNQPNGNDIPNYPVICKLKAGTKYRITGSQILIRNPTHPNGTDLNAMSNDIFCTPTEDTDVIGIRALITQGTTYSSTKTYYPGIWEDPDETRTEWVPFKRTSITIPLTSPLYEGDKICYVKPGESYVDAEGDTVVADRILYGVYRENVAAILDGSGDESLGKNAGGENIFSCAITNKVGSSNGGEQYLKCNKLTAAITNLSVSDMPDNSIKESDTMGSNVVFFNISEAGTTVESLRTWLSTNPLTVVYRLAQPYFEPFTDQSIFYSLRTDDTLTYIYSSDPIEPVLTVEVAKNSTGGYLLESYAAAQKNALSEADNASRLASVEQQLLTLNTTVSTMGGQ